MATVVIPLFLFIFARFSFGFEVIQGANSTKVDKDDGKSSLVFVFDTTWSMSNDLRQLRQGAEMILKTALEDSSTISNFVFVPFNDPLVGPATVTKDKNVFKATLNAVTIYGGGDCPEKSLGGIELALNRSLPRSFIYVFTDATASDYKLVGRVLDLVQRKQSQVVFVLTGHCNDQHRPSYKVYPQIAAASSGQVFNLNKTNVHMVLDFVRSSIKGRTVNLASAVRPAGYNYTQGIRVDKQIGEVTVSVAGARPQLEVVDPRGERLTGPPRLVTTLDLSEIMIVKVLDPEPGNWSITVGSERDYSVKVVGLSDLSFRHGFSVTTPSSMDETSYRPLQGTYNNLLITPSNPDVPVHIDFAEILDLSGNTIFEVPLKPLTPVADSLYLADAFMPPDDFFNIAINGHDENGQPFRRISPTAVQPKSPDAPYLTVPQKVQARYHERVVLPCVVDSLVPVAAGWTKNGRRIVDDVHALGSTVLEYVIPAMSEADVGVYRCVATNVAGQTKQPIILQLTVDPPQVTISGGNSTVPVSSVLVVACHVISDAPLTLSQIVFTSSERENVTEFTLERADDGLYSFNTSFTVDEGSGGKYTCVAANKAGRSEQSTYISVVKPVAQILGPHEVTKRRHSDVQFVCHADNSERVQWIGPDDVIVHDTVVNGSYNAMLDVDNVTADGVWKCVAIRGTYQATDSISLSVVWKPRVMIEGAKNVSVMSESVFTARCVVEARPAPRVLWHRETEAFLNHTMTALANDTYISELTLDSSKEAINATYFCFGENSEGIDQDSLTVSVRRKMALLEGFTDQSVELYSQVSLSCRVDCQPPAEYSWFHNGTALSPDEEDPSVARIERVEFQHLGLYVCVADNGLEKIEVNGSLRVDGLESPALSKEPWKQIVKTGEAVVLTCRVLKGNPKPDITWSFKNESSMNFTVLLAHVIVRNGGSEMEVPRADVGDAGSYRCVAANVVGQDVYDVTLVVHFPPRLPVNESHLEAPVQVKLGDKKTLSCHAVGLPPPIVTWTKFGQPVSFSDNVHLTDNNELVIETATEYDAGMYACKISNALGAMQRNFTLQVYSAPTIAPPGIDLEINVVEGSLVALPCAVTGAPPPHTRWLHNGAPVGRRRHFVDEYGLRFVSNLTDFGEYSCVASNPYGNTSITYNVFVWVPPHIVGGPEVSVSARAGSALRVACDAVGFPVPAVRWQFRGHPLLANTTHIQFDDIGNLLITNVSAEHGGVYACVAHNMVGEQKKYILLSVEQPPTILPDYVGPYIATDADSALVVPCRARGAPRPHVVWAHQGRYLDTDGRYKTDGEGSLVMEFPSVEQSGRYTCVAANVVGNASREVDVQIYPYLTGMQAEESRSAVTLVEGAPAAVTCPIPATGDTTLKWYKDAKLIANGTLTFSNVSRHNASTYACVASNVVASAYANVDVEVQWAPRFVENVLERVEVVKGDDWYFDCRVDSKPAAKVKWYFNSQLLLGADKDVLKLLTVEPHRAGFYKCIATNEHGTITRRFTLDVLVAPSISEFDMLDVQLMEGSSASLDCNAKGTPAPEVKWIFNNTNWSQLNSSLHSVNVTRASEGLYRCEARNKAGAARLLYRVGVVTPAKVEGVRVAREGVVEIVEGKVEVALGSDIRIACQGKGNPPPIIRWSKHGNTISENDKGIGYADLVLKHVNASNAGVYSCIASNEGGMDERKIKVEILEPPRIFRALFQTVNSSDNVIAMEVLSGQPLYLHCHPSGTPLPEVYWFKDDVPLRLFDDSMVSTEYGETLVASAARHDHAGNYTCVARNKVGNTSVVYLVDVLEAPPPVKDNVRKLVAHAGYPLVVTCPATGRPPPLVAWVKLPYTEISEQLPRVSLINDNYTLIINETQSSDSGKYSCVMTNKVGTTEVVFDVTINKAPSIAGNVGNNTIERHVVPLRRSLVLKCDADGYPMPKISWWKDIQPLDTQSVSAVGSRLVALWAVRARDAGTYVCVAENDSGAATSRYHVQVEVPGKWSEWSSWGYCSATCGAGQQTRSRRCRYVDDDNNTIDESTDNIIVDESTCKGPAVDRRKCHMPPCEEESGARWSAWSRWGPCSATCGAGTQARVRRCRGDAGVGCQGDNVQIRKCPNLPKCMDYKLDNTEPNEVVSNRENREIDLNPYTPEAAFETQAEVLSHRPAHTDGHVIPGVFPHQPSYDVVVTSNLDGSERGRCPPGYTHREDDSCHDIDECTIATNECHATQVCANTAGAYRCTCPPGYMSLGAGQRCLDVNECEVGAASCEFACVNTAGGYVCACPRHLRLHVDRHHCVAPALYRTPLSFDDPSTEEYLSASVDHPARYMKITRQ